EEENDLLFRLFEGLEAAVMDHVGHDQVNQYYVMVVHPWQYDHILLQEYKEELKTNRLIPIDYQQSYYAGLSFRTLMPKYPKSHLISSYQPMFILLVRLEHYLSKLQ